MDIKVSPSILSANFAQLSDEVERMVAAKADMIHFDVMDGHFVPNISFGIPVLKSLKPFCNIPMDVHLMITNPQDYIEQFVDAGADIITIHVECDCDIEKCIKIIKSFNIKVGLSVKPHTPVSAIKPYLSTIDMVLIMTVEPGFGGQSFMSDMMKKVSELRIGYPAMDIEVDGGINNTTAKTAIKAGANILVAGSYLFNSADVVRAINELKGIN